MYVKGTTPPTMVGVSVIRLNPSIHSLLMDTVGGGCRAICAVSGEGRQSADRPNTR